MWSVCSPVSVFYERLLMDDEMKRGIIMQGLPAPYNKMRLERYDKGAEIYHVCKKTFVKMARNANAVIVMNGIHWADLNKIDEFLESCRVTTNEDEEYY